MCGKVLLLTLVWSLLILAGCSPRVVTPSANLQLSSPQILKLTDAFPGEGYYSSVDASGLPSSAICSGKSLLGNAGSAVCQTGSTLTPALAPMILAGKEAWDGTGAKITGTMAVGANVTGANGSLTITIPSGYYDGTRTATASDSNLIAGNIALGVSLFGVTGSATLESHSNCTGANQSGCISTATYPTQSTPSTPATAAQVLTGKEFYVGGALQTGSMPDQGNWNMNTTAWPGAGYFSGLTSSIGPADVCSSKNIFGSAGTAVCQSGSSANPAGAANILSTYEAWDSSGTKMTGSMIDRGALNAQASFPGAGYYSATLTNAPVASQIVEGQTILGVSGTAAIPDFMGSWASRNDNSTTTLANLQDNEWASARARATLRAEGTAAASFTSNHRLVPDPKYDTDGFGDNTGIGQTRLNYLLTIQGRPTVVCGTAGSIDARITDCANQNGARAIWEGAKYGKGGEGDWKLVTLLNDGTRNWETWRDERTKLLWSDSTYHQGSDQASGGVGAAADFGNQYNWFQAAGYSSESASTLALTGYEGARAGSAGAGAKAYAAMCTTNTTQTCQPATPISVCADASLIAGLNGVANYSTPNNDYAKGNLGVSSTPVVRWRLPMIEDWEQANVNGIRFVLPNMGGFWSATSGSTDRNFAFQFSGTNGAILTASRFISYPVRCVAGGQ